MKKNILVAFLCLFPFSVHALDIIPRVGVNFGKYRFEYDEPDPEVKQYDEIPGLTAGLLFASPGFFIDLSTELYEVNWSTQKPKRSELALTLGLPVYKTIYLIGGYRTATYGTSYYKDDIGYQRGGFVGFSINNLRLGDDSKDILSLSYVFQPAEIITNYTNIKEDGVGYGIKLGWRRAGSPHNVSFRYQNFGAELEETIHLINYSYIFSSF
jgi:hypothetical protein